jgi:8-oxo-dGTP pyrophosphatase MutT (NUDIX family)
MSYSSANKRGAGCMIMSKRNGKFLMCKRSRATPYPSTWASFGGKAELNETPEQTARREAFEETGFRIEGEIEHLYHFETPTFSFDTFIADFEEEFTPRLNDEAEDASWMALEELPDNVHDGLREILEDKSSVLRLIKHVERHSGRPCDFDRIYRSPERRRA